MEIKTVGYFITKSLNLRDEIPPIEENLYEEISDLNIGISKDLILPIFSCYIALEKDPENPRKNKLVYIDFNREEGGSIFMYQMNTMIGTPLAFNRGGNMIINEPLVLNKSNDLKKYIFYRVVVCFTNFSFPDEWSSIEIDAIYLMARIKVVQVCFRAIKNKRHPFETGEYINRLFSVFEFINKWIGDRMSRHSILECRGRRQGRKFPETSSLRFTLNRVYIKTGFQEKVDEYQVDPLYSPAVRRYKEDTKNDLKADIVFHFFPLNNEEKEEIDAISLTDEQIILLLLDMSRVLLGNRTRSFYASPEFIEKCLIEITPNYSAVNSRPDPISTRIGEIINRVTQFLPDDPLTRLFSPVGARTEKEIIMRFIPELGTGTYDRKDLISAYKSMNDYYQGVIMKSFYDNYIYKCNTGKCYNGK